MKVIRYHEDDHRAEIDAWCAARAMPPIGADFISDTAYLVPGVFFAVLWLTNGHLAFMESMLANPAASKEERAAAISAVIDECCGFAARAGYRLMQGQTKLAAVVEIGAAHGFAASANGYTILVKPLAGATQHDAAARQQEG